MERRSAAAGAAPHDVTWPPPPLPRAKRSAAADHGTRAGAPRNAAGTTSQSRPRRTAQRPPRGCKQGTALQRRAAGARGTTAHAHRRTPSARGHTSAGPRRRPAACSITLLMLAACCKPPSESTTEGSCLAVLGVRQRATVASIRHVIGYAAELWRRGPAHERPIASTARAARSGRPRWPRGKISPFL